VTKKDRELIEKMMHKIEGTPHICWFCIHHYCAEDGSESQCTIDRKEYETSDDFQITTCPEWKWAFNVPYSELYKKKRKQ
jgi:hypothetical protein